MEYKNNDLIENEYQEINDLENENMRPRALDYIQSNSFKKEARSAHRKVIFSSVLYLLILNLLSIVVLNIFPGLQQGYLMIILVILSILPIYLLMGKPSNENIENHRRKFRFKDLIFFWGLMYLLTVVFSLIVNFLMNTFGIQSVDVTSSITLNMTADLFIYAVLIGPYIEELQFRGLYINHVKKYGAIATIILTSLTFSFMHMNFIQSIGTIGLGLVLGYVGYFYSFKAAILLHVLNNLYAAVVGMIVIQFGEDSLILSVFGFIIIGMVLYFLMTILSRERQERLADNLGHVKKNPDVKKYERVTTKILLTDPIFIIYVIVMIGLSIAAGYIV